MGRIRNSRGVQRSGSLWAGTSTRNPETSKRVFFSVLHEKEYTLFLSAFLIKALEGKMKIKTKQKQLQPFFMAKDGVRTEKTKTKKHALVFTTLIIRPYSTKS